MRSLRISRLFVKTCEAHGNFLIVFENYQPHVVIYALSLPIRECQRPLDSGPRRPSMKLRPLQDRVLIRRVEPEAKTAGGIFIPDTAQEKPMEGEVIAAGAGARVADGKVHPLAVKTGDRVLFGKWSGTEVKLDGEDLMIMKESDLLGVIEVKTSSKSKAA